MMMMGGLLRLYSLVWRSSRRLESNWARTGRESRARSQETYSRRFGCRDDDAAARGERNVVLFRPIVCHPSTESTAAHPPTHTMCVYVSIRMSDKQKEETRVLLAGNKFSEYQSRLCRVLHVVVVVVVGTVVTDDDAQNRLQSDAKLVLFVVARLCM